MGSASSVRAVEGVELEVVACAAHEIRNALVAIGGYGELLARRTAQLTPDEVALIGSELVGIVKRSDVLLTDLLEDRPPGWGDAEPVDLGEALSGALAMAPPDEAVVAVPEGVRVLAGPGRVEQVVTNLVMNSRRHAGEGATVSVTAVADVATVTVAVTDNGPWVPAWAADHIFEPFFQADRAARAGTGLGLAIVKRLVEAYGGTVRYEPADGGGARFVVVLRRA